MYRTLRIHASVTIPALFLVLSTFTIGHGLGNVFLGIPNCSAVLTSTKFSVAPLSISALAVTVPQVHSKTTLILRGFLWLTYTWSRDMACTQATWVEPSKKIRMADHSESVHPAVEFFLLCSSLISLSVQPFYPGLQLLCLH